MLVYDLLVSPDCLPDLLQGSLKNKGRDEAFLLSSFRLHSKAPTSLFSVINPTDNTKYLDLTMQAKLSKGEHWHILRSLWQMQATLFFVLASLQLSFKHLYICSDCSLPEDWWQIWYNQFQPCIPGRWTRAPRDAPCQRSTAWPWSCSHLCRLQAGSHFGWCASRVWVTSTRSQQGGTQDAAVKRTGEWEVCSWERKKKVLTIWCMETKTVTFQDLILSILFWIRNNPILLFSPADKESELRWTEYSVVL